MAKKKRNIFVKTILTLFTFIICFAVVGSIYFYQGLSKLSEGAKEINKQLQNSNAMVENTGEEEEKFDEDKKSINILALGVDIGTPGVDDKNDPKRTDTMLLLHYNSETEGVSVVSIPRDTLIKINGKNIKINSAHAIGGVEYAVDAVEKLLNINIDYYGKVNYEGFRKLIDSVGGVDMKIEHNMDYDDPSQNLHIHFKKGETVHLDGEKAEGFFRWRKNNNGTGLAEGDLGRIGNQHLFMSKLLEKLKSPWIIPRIPAIFMTLPKYCETNMSADEIIKYGFAFIRAKEVNMDTIKGESEYLKGLSYFVYDKNSNKEILDKIQDKNITKAEIGINKKEVKIKVLNATNKSGLASNYKKYLQSKGYKNIDIGNANPTKKSTIMLQNNFDKTQQNYIKTDFGITTIKNVDNKLKEFDIIVMLGEDHKYIF